MTNQETKIVTLLLKGHFLRQQKRGNKIIYVIYDEKVNPISRVKSNFIKSIYKKVPSEIELWKYNKHGDISLNLSMVRRLHGNNIIKRIYKKRKDLQATGSIYNLKSSKKIKQANEKVLYLF